VLCYVLGTVAAIRTKMVLRICFIVTGTEVNRIIVLAKMGVIIDDFRE
jgi:uncharacterized membrane protein (Fun14 family)